VRKRRGRPPNVPSTSRVPKRQESAEDEESDESRPRDKEEEIHLKNESLRIYREKVEKRIRQKVNALIDRTEQAFQKIHLDLGPSHPFPPPWQSPNWTLVEQRCQQRKRKSDPQTEDEQKKPKLEPPVVIKKGRGRPRHKPPVLEVQVVKKMPGRPRKHLPAVETPVKVEARVKTPVEEKM
jgi:hypothetical protein